MAQPSKEFLSNAIYLVDASSYIFRAYYGLSAKLSAPDGTPTHATFGFLQMIQSLIDQYKVKRCVLLWDQKDKGFRHEIFPEYKANRSAPPEDLSLQIENSKIGVDALGLSQLDLSRYEADDLIATMVAHHPEENFVIVTGDKDLLQLVGPRVWCLDTLKQKWSNKDEAFEKFGVSPEQIPEVQALCGDSVDNIPGAPGIGPKTATQLIQYYKSLDAVLEAALSRYPKGDNSSDKSEKEDPLKGKRIASIAENIDKIRMSLQLVKLDRNAPVPKDLSRFVVHAPNWDLLQSYAQKLGFARLLEQAQRRHEKKMDESEAESASSFSSNTPAGTDAFVFKRVESLDHLRQILNQHKNVTRMALDTETLGLELKGKGDLVGLSLAFDSKTGYYVPLRHSLQQEFNLPPEQTLEILKNWLQNESPQTRIVFQNAKFDLHVFLHEGLLIEAHRIDDTMIASFVLNPAERHDMDSMSLKYLNYACVSFKEALGENENFSQVDLAKATRYAAEDAVVTYALWEELSKRLATDTRLQKIYSQMDVLLASLLFRMEEAGILLDLQTTEKLSKEFHRELEEREKEAIEILKNEGLQLPEDFNLASTKQLAKILFEDLKLPIIKKGKTGPSTDASVLEELSGLHPFPQKLIEIREINKLLSTYIDVFPKLLRSTTHRLHTEMSQVIAVTGRLSSSNPNLQNIPIRTERGRRLREAFCAPEGSQLLGIDYSQIELRILAHMSEDKELIRAFTEGADIHKRTAALVLGIDESKVSAEDRRMAKAINFGIVYGQTPFGLAKSLGIDLVQAKRFIDDYFHTYPGIKTYMEQILEEARRTGRVKTLAGRIRYLPDIQSRNPTLRNFAERTAINSPIQGTAADLIKVAMLNIDAKVLPQFPSVKLILQIHDELLFEVPNDVDAFALETALKEQMEDRNIFEDWIGKSFLVPMKAEASLGPHWGALK